MTTSSLWLHIRRVASRNDENVNNDVIDIFQLDMSLQPASSLHHLLLRFISLKKEYALARRQKRADSILHYSRLFENE